MFLSAPSGRRGAYQAASTKKFDITSTNHRVLPYFLSSCRLCTIENGSMWYLKGHSIFGTVVKLMMRKVHFKLDYQVQHSVENSMHSVRCFVLIGRSELMVGNLVSFRRV
jgi:hypothetical protein